MKKQYGLALLLIPLILSFVGRSVNAVDSFQKNLTLTCTNEAMWMDNQWKFYSQTVGYEDFLEVSLNYTGELDIDLRMFVDFDAKPWDITREGIDKVPLEDMLVNAQNRGSNSVEYGRYYNNQYSQGMTVYVLIFVFSGTGSSAITISSNKELAEYDPGTGGFLGFILDNILYVTLVFAAAMIGLVLVMNHYRKKYRRYIAEQKEKVAKEKLGHQAAKY